MSQARAKYRSALRRFNSSPISRNQKEGSSTRSPTAQYNGFNKSSGTHEVINPEGEITSVDASQNKSMGLGDEGYVNQGFFVL